MQTGPCGGDDRRRFDPGALWLAHGVSIDWNCEPGLADSLVYDGAENRFDLANARSIRWPGILRHPGKERRMGHSAGLVLLELRLVFHANLATSISIDGAALLHAYDGSHRLASFLRHSGWRHRGRPAFRCLGPARWKSHFGSQDVHNLRKYRLRRAAATGGRCLRPIHCDVVANCVGVRVWAI